MNKKLSRCLPLLLAMLILWISWGNTALELNAYTVSSDRLSEAFSGFRIAQISDLHNARMGPGNQRLLALLKQARPDIIVITGDFVDYRRTDLEVALELAEEACQIAPCYYVTGNQEMHLTDAEFELLTQGLINAGVSILRNEAVRISRGDASLSIAGVEDQEIWSPAVLDELAPSGGYRILLAHRPERFDSYQAAGFDLVFSGHVHGGQFRLPFLGGVYGPGQGFFPKYDAGVYEENGSSMVVSRGIGNSSFPFRLNNPPELVLVTLQSLRENTQ